MPTGDGYTTLEDTPIATPVLAGIQESAQMPKPVPKSALLMESHKKTGRVPTVSLVMKILLNLVSLLKELMPRTLVPEPTWWTVQINIRCSNLRTKSSPSLLMSKTCHAVSTVLFTSSRCKKMEVWASTLETMPVPHMELDIVMLNAHKILNSSMVKLTQLDGLHPQLTQMPVPENSELAALRWISGRPTLSLKLSLLIHVPWLDQRNVKDLSAVREIKDTRVSAIKMDVISTHIEPVTTISMVQEKLLILPSQSKLLLNSLLPMVPTLETWKKSEEFSFKTARSSKLQILKFQMLPHTILSLMICATPRKVRWEIQTISRLRVVLNKWEKPWITVWSLLCPSGMIMHLTCFGSTPLIQPTRLKLVDQEDHALPHQEFQKRLNHNIQTLVLNSLTSNSERLVLPTVETPQDQLHQLHQLQLQDAQEEASLLASVFAHPTQPLLSKLASVSA